MNRAAFGQIASGTPEVEVALDRFLDGIHGYLGDRLLSVILQGSILFDDLAPGYGDLDVVAVVADDLAPADVRELTELRRPLRSGQFGVIATMIEGAFLPRPMLDPRVTGSALWWGTSGERPWTISKLGALVLRIVREMGLVLYGEDVRAEIPPPTDEECRQDIRDFAASARAHARAGELHSVEWLLTSARMLLWLREGHFSSKSAAADWGFRHVDDTWGEFLPEAKRIRRNPWEASEPEVRRWLEGLGAPIAAAIGEVERELSRKASVVR